MQFAMNFAARSSMQKNAVHEHLDIGFSESFRIHYAVRVQCLAAVLLLHACLSVLTFLPAPFPECGTASKILFAALNLLKSGYKTFVS
jgi:hypothetical protein